MISLLVGGVRKSKAEAMYDRLVADLVSTPALLSASHHSWTMATEPLRQTRSPEPDGSIVFEQAEYSMKVGMALEPVFCDSSGREGRARIIETIPNGATMIYWEWDHGLEFPRHFHSWTETIVFLSGLWRMEVGGTMSVQGPGSILSIPSGVPHQGVVLEASRVITLSMPELR